MSVSGNVNKPSGEGETTPRSAFFEKTLLHTACLPLVPRFYLERNVRGDTSFSAEFNLHRNYVKLFVKMHIPSYASQIFCRDFTTSRTEQTDARIYWAASTSSWMILSSCRRDTGTSPPYCRRCNLSEKRSARNRSEDKNLKRRKVEDIFFCDRSFNLQLTWWIGDCVQVIGM